MWKKIVIFENNNIYPQRNSQKIYLEDFLLPLF